MARLKRQGWARRLASFFLLVLTMAVLAVAPRAGAGNDGFAQAVEAWLADDEAAALPDLAALAAAGDARAQLLLGLIDKTPALQGPWLSRLSRNDRIALMRAPAGLSGQSWLQRIEEDPLAAQWRALLQVGTGQETVIALTEMGEHRTARQAVLTMALREELSPGDHWPEWLDPELAWAVWPFAREPLRAEIARQVPPGHPQWAMMGGAPPESSLAAWLQDSGAARPLQALCDALCPDSAETCRLAGYRALGSHGALLTLGSPAETLIPGDRFLASPRGRQAVLRRMLMSTDMRGRAALLARIHSSDACLGAELAATADRFRPNRSGQPASP